MDRRTCHRKCHRTYRRVVALSLVLLACRASDPTTVPAATIRIEIVTSAPVLVGTPLSVAIINESADAQGYNMCASAQLEQQRDGQWTRVDPGNQVCNLSLTVLAARARGEAVYLLPRTLGAGTYRLVIFFRPERNGAASIRAESGSFTVG